ncbi:AIM24 family protein [Thermoflavimicrobium daqui]|uniref:Transcriptional regulator n=1 Tax=Thermoflavimicrobium daqui TaxID=2137476 RepID=A0A364K281_9BACL|nr:AIM24 family protein [Thermoflavimicrobium daqui]RAL22520.1 transcriptional regulator [Thermoflavimicrobium daqui]
MWNNQQQQIGEQLILSKENGGVRFEVIQHYLKGSSDLTRASELYYAQKAGVRLKQVRILLNNAGVQIEAGALHYMRGNLDVKANIGGVSGLLKKMVTSKVTGEEMFKPLYQGYGEIFLEPSFDNYLLVELSNEEMVCDDGMFYACEAGIDVGAYRNKGLTALLGDEGAFQTRLTGTGICCLTSPVPIEEIKIIHLQNETLQVDGNFTLLRKGNIEFTVERSSKSMMGSLTSGEGLLQTFRGTGEVWLAPTLVAYSG